MMTEFAGPTLIFVSMMIGATPRDSDAGAWKHSMTSDLTASQVQFHDWASGGEDALSWQFDIKGRSRLSESRMDWDWKYQFRYGQTKRGDEGARKTEDMIALETQLTRRLGMLLDPYLAASFRTQISAGHRYSDAHPRIQVSHFWDPAYISESIGVGREFGGGVLKVRGGASFRQVGTRDFNRYSDDPATDKTENFSNEFGVEIKGGVDIPLSDTARFTSDLKGFRKTGQAEWVIRGVSLLRIQVNKVITVTIGATAVDDPRSSDDLQIKQSATAGLGYTLW